jgi:hypothetical protein
LKDHKKEQEVRVLNLLDEDFKLDVLTFKIAKISDDLEKSFRNQAGSEEAERYGCENVAVKTFEHLQLRGYCFHWPFFVYSNIDGNLIIFNAFEPNILNVVPLSEKFKILEMYITDTADLFIAGRRQDLFQIFWIDLDLGNIKNYNNDKEIISKQMFRPNLLLQYARKEVDGKKLTKIHARGSSRKEKIDVNNKLTLFILHE